MAPQSTTLRDPVRQILALDEFHDERTDAVGFFETVDVGDVGMIQRGERLGFLSEPRQPIRIAGEGVGQNLQRYVTIQLRVVGAIHLAHAPFADLGRDFIDAEARAGSEGQVADYTGRTALATRLVLSDGPGLMSPARGGPFTLACHAR
jgi:hypothetical protein